MPFFHSSGLALRLFAHERCVSRWLIAHLPFLFRSLHLNPHTTPPQIHMRQGISTLPSRQPSSVRTPAAPATIARSIWTTPGESPPIYGGRDSHVHDDVIDCSFMTIRALKNQPGTSRASPVGPWGLLRVSAIDSHWIHHYFLLMLAKHSSTQSAARTVRAMVRLT